MDDGTEGGGQVALRRPRPHRRRRARRRLIVAVVLVGTLILAARLAADRVTTARAPAPVAATRAATPSQAAAATAVAQGLDDRAAALESILSRRAAALLARDREKWLEPVDPSAADFLTAQAEVYDRLGPVPLVSWEYDVVAPGPPATAEQRRLLGADTWTADVVLTYRLAADGQDTRRHQRLVVSAGTDGWRLAGADADSTEVDVWDLGPVAVVSGTRSLVIGSTQHEARLQRYAGDVDAAAQRVDEVWGTAWPRTVVVVVPTDVAAMARLLGRSSTSGLDQIAAVTTGEIARVVGTATPPKGTADRVVLNPQAFESFGALGRRVVLTHEVTHVATRATSVQAPPIWIEEGFADYVAYRGTGLSRADVAADVLKLVAADRTPEHLPTEADFDPTKGDVAAAYAGAWLAMDLVSREDGGLRTVVRLYRAASGLDSGVGRVGSPDQLAADALADVLGTDLASFERRWRAYLVTVAGSSR